MRKTSGALLYVSDIGNEDVEVFSYPDDNLVGTLTGFAEPNGLCSDKNGDVFVTDEGANAVMEYAHGGTKPIATLTEGSNDPIGCAVDPKTGDLAVTNYTRLETGSVGIFKSAKGTATIIPALYRTFFPAYDKSGNLYIDGFNSLGTFALVEVKKGTSSISDVNFQATVGWTGGLVWSENHLLVGDQYANKFERSRDYINAVYQLSSKKGTWYVTKTAPLQGARDVVQFWLQGATIIAPDAREENVGYFKYPSGGEPTSTITGFYEPVGATVSQ